MGAIEKPPILQLPGIPDFVTYTWVIMVGLAVVAFVASRRVELVPRGLQNVFEVVLEQFVSLVDDLVGREGRPYLPLRAPPGIFVFFVYHWIGIRKQGPLRYVRHFMGPVVWLAPLMLPIEFISHLARPLSLSLRLFGNMMGGHILLASMFFLMGLDGLFGWALSGSLAGLAAGGPTGLLVFVFVLAFLVPLKILVSLIQAFVFVMLTCLYIAGALEEAEHHGEPHAEHH